MGELAAVEPNLDDVLPHVAALTAAYNDPANAQMLGHTALLVQSDVMDHYESLLGQGAHPFLLYCDGEFFGDGDIRGIRDGSAEFAFMIASPSAQGKGLGTRFALMIHAYGFQHLSIIRMYASIVPTNVASRRVFEKLGYTLDASIPAREYADDEGDIVMSISGDAFQHRHSSAIANLRIAMR